MSLSQEQVAQFHEAGYTAVPEFFDAREVAAMQAEVERWKAEGLLHNVRTEGDGATHSRTKQNLQLCPLYKQSPLFRAMPFEPKVVDAVAALIGEDFILHLDQTFLKPARTGSGTNWHQDNAYFRIADPRGGTAMWIAVHDATVANGTIRVIPRLWDQALEHQRDPESDHHIRCWPDESQAVHIELPAGGVAFFAYGTPHATGPNETERDRAGVAFHFMRREMAETGKGNRPIGTELRGAKCTGGLAEYGEVVAGTWPKLVEKMADAPAA